MRAEVRSSPNGVCSALRFWGGADAALIAQFVGAIDAGPLVIIPVAVQRQTPGDEPGPHSDG